MRIPEAPPKTGDDASSKFWRELEAKLLPLEDQYLHWDHLRQKQIPIVGVNHKQWWQLLKAKRRARVQSLPFSNGLGQPYYWVLDDRLVKKLMAVERYIHTELEPVVNQSVACEAFIHEAVASHQLSNVKTDNAAAIDLLATGRPATENEQPVLNHYMTLMQLSDSLAQPLSESLLHTWWSELMGQPFTPAAYRNDDAPQTYQVEGVEFNHAPLPHAQVPTQLKKLCAFANQTDEDYPGFMHPIIKALLLMYILIHDQPFQQGNARLSKTLFYWHLLKNGYSVLSAVSLSNVITQHLAAYYQAFLYVATDDDDLTYFLLQQLDLLLLAMQQYSAELKTKLAAQHQMMQHEWAEKLNPRQLTILQEMRSHPQREYRLATYKQRFDVTYETSRTDLMQLARLKLAKQRKVGKAFIYSGA